MVAPAVAAHRPGALRRRSRRAGPRAAADAAGEAGIGAEAVSGPAPSAWRRLYTFLNYLILTGYDQLAFLYIRRPIARWQIAMASFVGYAIANNVGFALLSGTSARYRFYSRWGLSGQEISRVVLFYSGTFWLGLLVLGGWALASGPAMGVDTLRRRRGIGARDRLGAAGDGASRTRSWRSSGGAPVHDRAACEIAMPSLGLVIGRSSCCRRSTGAWPPPSSTCCCRSRGPTSRCSSASFLAAQLIALVSHVPGGLGVFESLMILMLQLPAEAVLPALAMFRVDLLPACRSPSRWSS